MFLLASLQWGFLSSCLSLGVHRHHWDKGQPRRLGRRDTCLIDFAFHGIGELLCQSHFQDLGHVSHPIARDKDVGALCSCPFLQSSGHELPASFSLPRLGHPRVEHYHWPSTTSSLTPFSKQLWTSSLPPALVSDTKAAPPPGSASHLA